jgi:hypothetical protein
MARETERIVVSEDGLSLPVIEVLTGRGVIFGKSGSGKSNSASVIVEELLEKGFPLLIVDIEGEYATLKDRYEIVHVGKGSEYDFELFETEPERIVDFCLDQNRPVIVDISDVLEIDGAHALIEDTLTLLFSREKRVQQPFLVIVEEIHEFLPQQGGLDDLGETLIRIAKRGRKRGLGLCGLSQRPASVDKDFITQCDWLVWHRLTWENDTRVVKSILGSDTARDVQDLETGEAIMMTDWDETVRRVMFRRKRTADAGDTPTLSKSARRDLTASPDTGADRQDRTVESGMESPTAPAGDRDPDSSAESSSATDLMVEPYPATMDEAAAAGADGTEVEEETESSNGEAESERPADIEAVGSQDAIPTEAGSTDPELREPDGHEPVAATLWELGQFVTYVLVKLTNSVVYGSRVLVAKATGANEPADRLAPVSHQNRDPDPSRWSVWIVLALIGVVLGLLVLAVVT